MYRLMLTSLSLLSLAGCAGDDAMARGDRNTDFVPAFAEQFRAPLQVSTLPLETSVLAEGLGVPWGIATLPEGEGFLVTERAGRLRHLSIDGVLSEPLSGLPDIHVRGQGGLLDVAVAQDFASTRHVYLTYAKPLGDGMSATAAARGTLSADRMTLADTEDIFVQDPPSPTSRHYGSRIVFDGEGHAFVTTGEHSSLAERGLAQDPGTTYGKVVRVDLDGSTPNDNPFIGDSSTVDTIWSLGHRNVQGAAIDAQGVLWTIEHGPRGGDELNRPERGKNYGWPLVSYGEQYSGAPIGSGTSRAEGFEEPVYFWDPVIAPSGMSFHRGESFAQWNGDLLIGGLVAGAVVRLDIGEDGLVHAEERLLPGIGRVRDVEILDDGSFLVLTEAGSGRIVQVSPGDQR